MASVVETTDWLNCYDDSWKGIIVDEAFAHPAKISYALAQRIYEHAFKAAWLKPGDTVVDPFGGIGGTAIHAATHGVKWIGCELEPKFHAMAEQNFALWRDRWGMIPEWVQPVMHCGDSRRLAEVLGMAELCVSSPPYSETHVAGSSKGGSQSHIFDSWDNATTEHYGNTPGQLGSMREGDIAAVLSSPPYAESINAQSHGFDWTKAGPATGNRKRGDDCKHGQTFRNQLAYGQTPGQLGAMVVGSPPYEGSNDHERPLDSTRAKNGRHAIHLPYGESGGQLGNESGETFWQAARDIVIQCHQILKPGGESAPDGIGIDFCSCASRGVVYCSDEQAQTHMDMGSGVLRGRGEYLVDLGQKGNEAGNERSYCHWSKRQATIGSDQVVPGEQRIRARSVLPASSETSKTSEPDVGSFCVPPGRGDPVSPQDSSNVIRETQQGRKRGDVSPGDGCGERQGAVEGMEDEAKRNDVVPSSGCVRNRQESAAQLREIAGDAAPKRLILQNTSYAACSDCGKPVSGTGKTLGGVAIFVCKDFVRKGARVPFSDQWLALCEAIGFRLECRHRAMLVKRGRKQKLLDGGEHEPLKERKSFFRRLAEKKGSPRIDWEDVICVRKM